MDETLGQLLVAEGFSTIEEIKDSKIDNLSKIEGIEEETAKELVQRAKEFYQKDQEEIQQKIKDLGIQSDLTDHKGLTPGMLLTLGEQKILSLNDFADLASDELIGVATADSEPRLVGRQVTQILSPLPESKRVLKFNTMDHELDDYEDDDIKTEEEEGDS